MRLLESVQVPSAAGRKSVELCHGDLTKVDVPADLLAISAHPNEYIPTPGSLIGALHRAGIVVGMLALARELDYCDEFGCWLSHSLGGKTGVMPGRVLCFEPRMVLNLSERARLVFRGLVAVSAHVPTIRTVDMPVLFSGGAGLPEIPMALELLDEAVHWMALGAPFDRIRLIVRDEVRARQIAAEFTARKADYREWPFRPVNEITHDVFVSYSRNNSDEAARVVRLLKSAWSDVRIFIDESELSTGGRWHHQLLSAIDACRKMVALLSPGYMKSSYCIDEYNIAYLRGRNQRESILYPIYLQSTTLPTYMHAVQYRDCREVDVDKLSLACADLVRELRLT